MKRSWQLVLLVLVAIIGFAGGRSSIVVDNEELVELQTLAKQATLGFLSQEGFFVEQRSNGEIRLRAPIPATADLESVVVAFIDAEGHNLSKSNIEIRESIVYKSNLSHSNLDGVSFFDSRFIGCDLIGSSLRKANLNKVVFEQVDVSNADLSGAQLGWANLRGSKNIEKAILKGAYYTSETVWPKGFNPSLSGAILAY